MRDLLIWTINGLATRAKLHIEKPHVLTESLFFSSIIVFQGCIWRISESVFRVLHIGLPKWLDQLWVMGWSFRSLHPISTKDTFSWWLIGREKKRAPNENIYRLHFNLETGKRQLSTCDQNNQKQKKKKAVAIWRGKQGIVSERKVPCFPLIAKSRSWVSHPLSLGRSIRSSASLQIVYSKQKPR